MLGYQPSTAPPDSLDIAGRRKSCWAAKAIPEGAAGLTVAGRSGTMRETQDRTMNGEASARRRPAVVNDVRKPISGTHPARRSRPRSAATTTQHRGSRLIAARAPVRQWEGCGRIEAPTGSDRACSTLRPPPPGITSLRGVLLRRMATTRLPIGAVTVTARGTPACARP